jgi:hypothetical protein
MSPLNLWADLPILAAGSESVCSQNGQENKGFLRDFQFPRGEYDYSIIAFAENANRA